MGWIPKPRQRETGADSSEKDWEVRVNIWGMEEEFSMRTTIKTNSGKDLSAGSSL